MKIYIRKLNSQQCTNKSISVIMPIFQDFFEDKDVITVKGKKSGKSGEAPFTFTRDRQDPRFGGVFKEVLRAEGGGSFKIGDILLVEKASPAYIISLITEKDNEYTTYNSLLQQSIHSEISIDKGNDEFDHGDILNHNIYGIHITNRNDALGESRPHICIGWSAMGDLTNVSTKEELKQKHMEVWNEASSNSRGQDVGQIWRFISEANIGDYVIYADGNLFHIGKIESDYYYDDTIYENQDQDYKNVRQVTWLKKNLSKNMLSDVFRKSLGAGMSFWTLNDYKSAVAQLLNDTYVKDEIVLESEADMLVESIGSDYLYTVEELVKELNEMYSSADSRTQSNAIRMFGFKYAESIAACGVSPQKIVDDSDIDSNSYGAEIQKGINMYNSIKNNEYGVAFAERKEITQTEFDYSITKGEGINKIFYGTPGCGKSYHIEYDILGRDKDTKKYNPNNYAEENVIRTTFYQDYSNTDFVGQILPKIVRGKNGEKDTVEYIFNPGPFTLALIQAISNPTKKVALVVEEINRGNAPAIFGDIFQLLDRDDDCISEYGIVNVGVLDYLNNYEFTIDGEKEKYIFNEIKIPGNMYIYATMNTSDQNVYTLDTAFTRRWSKERIENKFGTNEIKDMYVPGMTSCTWGTFVDKVNIHIRSKIDELQVNEDKQVGCFFVKKSDLLVKDEADKDKKKAKLFAYKVLEYLWDDVSKLDHSVIFAPHYTTFEDLVKDYLEKGVEVFNGEIFK